MRADRVKPGMLVKYGAHWRVIVGPAETSPDGPYLPSSEGELSFGVGEDVEAVRLTAPQVEALRNVGRGLAFCSSRAGGKPTWKLDGFWQPLPASPYTRIRELGLIQLTAGIQSAGVSHRADFEVTPSGRALLDLLDKEGK